MMTIPLQLGGWIGRTRADRNMDLEVNDALLDHLRLTLIAPDRP